MNKKLYFGINLFILFLFIYFRLYLRAINLFWTDEIEEIKNLISLKHLIFQYLPQIPGGSPGHYLLTFPFNILYPYNKYVLMIPGLLSQVAVFILIPGVIVKLFKTNLYETQITALITRIIFTFDPTLSYQSIEIRPYSILPLLWVSIAILLPTIYDQTIRKTSFIGPFKKFLLILCLFILIIFHYYVLLMMISVYVYIYLNSHQKSKGYLSNSFSKIVSIGTLLSIPILMYFSPGSFSFNFDTLGVIKEYFSNYSFLRSNGINRIYWQNFLYYAFIILSLIIPIVLIKVKLERHEKLIKSLLRYLIKSIGILAVFPIVIIFFLDLYNHYWFLLRQFAWAMIPLYMSVGLFISKLLFIRHK